MSNPDDRKYHAAHTWLKVEPDGTYCVGITDHAQNELGDVVYVQPPAVGSTVTQGDACGVIESVKTAADLHAPVGGTVTEINSALEDAPERINSEPYAAWIYRMTLGDSAELAALLDAAAYEKQLD